MLLRPIIHLRKHIELYPVVAITNAGKTTLTKMLALVGADHGLGVITISDMIRENIRNETPIGLEYKKFLARMTNRQLMPCDLVMHGLAQDILKLHNQGKTKIAVDGAPRTVLQALEMLRSRIPGSLLELLLDEVESNRRDAERQKKENRTDNGKNAEGILVFKNETLPGIKLYKKEGAYHGIDAMRPLDVKIRMALNNMNFRRFEVTEMLFLLTKPGEPAKAFFDEVEGRVSKTETEKEPAREPAWKSAPWAQQTSEPARATA